MARVGLMLYTVRQAAAADFESTLREVGAMGFEGVELFDLHGHTPVRRGLVARRERSRRLRAARAARGDRVAAAGARRGGAHARLEPAS